MKKYILSVLCSLMLLVGTAAAANTALFPAPYTGEDGVTRWGYLDENGTQQVGYFYAAAEPFNAYGFAVVRDAKGETGVIDTSGKTVIELRESPRTVDFTDGAIAYRYATESVYFDTTGKETGTYEGAAGFFSNGLLRVQRGGRWGYINTKGELAIPARFADAGDFIDGRALVKQMDGTYAVQYAAGTRAGLPAEPAALTIGHDGLIVLRDEDSYRLYSLNTGSYLTPAYDKIEVEDDGYVAVQKDKKWGILTQKGTVSVLPRYYYLSYMGEGAYAVRGAADASVEAIEGSGARIYRTDAYVGGFETFRFGQSWHGTMDGGVLFFNKNGVLSRQVSGASNPVILTANVARVTVNGAPRYIRLSDGKVLYAPVRAYTLDDGIKVTTKTYEKYLGMKNGVEYGWNVEYPQFSGMKDSAVQTKLNTAIEGFFLDGPSVTAQTQPLTGSYGFAFAGRVLVVNAQAQVGQGVGATIWNDSIALDFGTGARYSVTGDLFQSKYEATVRAALPSDTPFYRYSYPRIGADGVTFYVNHAQTEEDAPYSEAFKLSFDQLWPILNTKGTCYAAITGAARTEPQTVVQGMVTGFSDVPGGYWAQHYIERAAADGLMTGDGASFRPEDNILASEAVVTLARALSLPSGRAPGITGVWYADAYGGAYEYGLLAGLGALRPNAALTRADAMQLFANAAGADHSLSADTVRGVLSQFSDGLQIVPARREAAAFCVEKSIFAGSGGKLRPNDTLTRAEFAKLLTTLNY